MKYWVSYFASQWKIFVATLVLSAAIGGLYLSNTAPSYRISLTIAAAGGADTGNALDTIGQVTSQVGVRLGSPDGIGGFDLFLASLKSPTAIPLMPDHDTLMQRIFPVGGNDERLASHIAASLSVRGTSTPNVHEMVFTGPDPKLASDLLRNLHTAADRLVRQHALAAAEAEIAILNKQIEKTSIAELRQAISNRLLKLLTRAGLAKSEPPFAAIILEAPRIPAQPVSPSHSGVWLLSILAGLGAGFFISLLRVDNAATA